MIRRRECPAGAAVLAGVLLAASAAPAPAATVVIQPSSQDAYIQQDRPNRIAGAGRFNTRVRVRGATTLPRVWRGFVQFDLAAIPAAATVHAAILELFEGNNPGVALTHGLHRVAAPWLQSAVKWSNQPPHDSLASATASVGTSRDFKAFDVTADVAAFVAFCSDDHGWLIKDQDESGNDEMVNYIAKEEDGAADLGNRPRLTVSFTPPSCVSDADCADANFCTSGERCVAGACVVDQVVCDDGDPCTDDLCDCDSGCIHAPICDDGFSCTLDTCDPDTQACAHTPVEAVCIGQCATGTCVADQDRDDLDPETGCLITSVSPPGSACSDADACTEADACDGAGACVPGAPVVCTAASQCHEVGACDALTGVCSDPPKPAGAACGDGDACTQEDACDGAGGCVPGDPVVCTALDQCHTAGTCDPETGVCSEPTRPDGTLCDDGEVCTIADACADGVCTGDSATCGDGVVQAACGEECDDAGDDDCTSGCRYLCGPAPATGCKLPATAGKAFVTLKDKTPDKRDLVLWKWLKGAATTDAEVGDPLATTTLTLCLWDESGRPQPLVRAVIPPGGTCGGKPCWKRTRRAFKYRDRTLARDGIQQVIVQPGAATMAKLSVKGKGESLGLPALPLVPRVTVQLKSDVGTCWEAGYVSPQKNQSDQFRSKAE